MVSAVVDRGNGGPWEWRTRTKEVKHLKYEDRLRALQLFSLKYRKTSIKRRVPNKRRVSNKRRGFEANVLINAGSRLNAGSQINARVF